MNKLRIKNGHVVGLVFACLSVLSLMTHYTHQQTSGYKRPIFKTYYKGENNVE